MKETVYRAQLEVRAHHFFWLPFFMFSRKNVRIIASIESALGVMNLKEIATADPRVDALVVRTIGDFPLVQLLNFLRI